MLWKESQDHRIERWKMINDTRRFLLDKDPFMRFEEPSLSEPEMELPFHVCRDMLIAADKSLSPIKE